jgi:hypothetical protein
MDLYVSPHPARSTSLFNSSSIFKDVRSFDGDSFALAIFGTTTSAVFEDKYSGLLKAVFLPTSSKLLTSGPGALVFSSFLELEEIIERDKSQPILSDSVTRSSDFFRWVNLLGRIKGI